MPVFPHIVSVQSIIRVLWYHSYLVWLLLGIPSLLLCSFIFLNVFLLLVYRIMLPRGGLKAAPSGKFLNSKCSAVSQRSFWLAWLFPLTASSTTPCRKVESKLCMHDCVYFNTTLILLWNYGNKSFCQKKMNAH